MKKLDMKSLVLGAMIGGAAVLSLAAATPEKRTVWEYKVVEGSIRDERLGPVINNQVAAGWEFVSAGQSSERMGFAVLRREQQK